MPKLTVTVLAPSVSECVREGNSWCSDQGLRETLAQCINENLSSHLQSPGSKVFFKVSFENISSLQTDMLREESSWELGGAGPLTSDLEAGTSQLHQTTYTHIHSANHTCSQFRIQVTENSEKIREHSSIEMLIYDLQGQNRGKERKKG